MAETPLFTIITPVYNRSEIVVQTILSVLDQQFSDFEYLLVNDASTDGSLDVLEAFARQDQRIKVIDLEENQGRCYARNEGLKHAQGEWICYLDSDDQYYFDHLSTMRDMIKKNPELKVFAVDQHINGILKKYRRKALHADKIMLTLNDFIEDNPLTANQLCHAPLADIQWSNERIPISEDWLFMRSLSLKYPILKTAVVTNNLRDHDDRSMNTTDAESFVRYNLLAANKFTQENPLPESISNRIRVYTDLLCANVYLKHKMKKKAFKIFKPYLVKPKTYTYALFYKAILKFFL